MKKKKEKKKLKLKKKRKTKQLRFFLITKNLKQLGADFLHNLILSSSIDFFWINTKGNISLTKYNTCNDLIVTSAFGNLL